MIDILPIEILNKIFTYLSVKDKKNIILLSKKIFNRFKEDSKHYINTSSFNNNTLCYNNYSLINKKDSYVLNYSRIHIKEFNNNIVYNLTKLHNESINTIIFDKVTIDIYNYILVIKMFKNLKNIRFIKVKIFNLDIVKYKLKDIYKNLESLTLEYPIDFVFDLFDTNLEKLNKITIINTDWTWNGFNHDKFNNILKKNNTITNLILQGNGTSSYFDSDKFCGNIVSLDTRNITWHWYVGIRSARVDFLKYHKDTLKELKIHNLPFDFDGGRVLKYIFNEMTLNTFYYKNIPLILNSIKQNITEIEANELNITSIYELFRQFPSIKKFTFNISSTDIASHEIELIINRETNIFEKVEEFIINDNSSYRSTLGVFLGLMKNINKVKKIKIISQDRNINLLLSEWFSISNPNLEEIYLSSNVSRLMERCITIKNFVPNLKKLSLYYDNENLGEIFNNSVKIVKLNNNNNNNG